ncbi:MAG: hypothetical protein HQ517_08375 [SAR324 cluster bacterium]|nr:hypothetical protein [SAR324 cluster bacterium]
MITPGSYGFSHGGLSPQELVTPYLCWEKDDYGAASLQIQISNKADLQNVTGDLYQINLQAGEGDDDSGGYGRSFLLQQLAPNAKSDFVGVRWIYA